MAFRRPVLSQRATRGDHPKGIESQAQQQLNEAIEARQSREWDRALALLRRGREYSSLGLLSYLRVSIWLDAGNPDVAAVFYGHASESDPANANYRAIYMPALAESDPHPGQEKFDSRPVVPFFLPS